MSVANRVTAVDVTVSPVPTDEETAAIMAATEALWPKPVAMIDETAPRNTSWRFSSRWWSRPVAVRRMRPWR